MNITLAVDERTVERAREIARQQGTSLNALIREYIELLANQATGDELLNEFQQMWADIDKGPGGSSRGYKFNREELYEERLSGNKGKRG
jgi:chromosome condensin MukBEF ATPase and DNA-binding subunit MukB